MGNLFNEKEKRFTALYQKYVDEIYKYVYMRTGMKSNVSEDITQEIFIAVYRGLYGFKGLCSERTWIYKIAAHKINDYYRKAYRAKEEIGIEDRIIEEMESSSLGLEESVMKELESEEVCKCIEKMPEQYQIVLTLRYMDEKSIKQIAEILEKTPKAVESLLQRAKVKFAERYRERSVQNEK